MTYGFKKASQQLRSLINEIPKLGRAGTAMSTAETTKEQSELLGHAPHNMIINGDMNVAQRADVNAAISGTNLYKPLSVDRWHFGYTSANGLNVQSEQSNDAPEHFQHSLKYTFTNTVTHTAGIYGSVWHRLERSDYNGAGFGTPNSKDLTLSFWVKSSNVGKYSGIHLIYPSDGGNSYCVNFQYRVNVANVWEKKIIILPSRQLVQSTFQIRSGAGAADYLAFHLEAGSNYSGGSGSDVTYITYATNVWAYGQEARMFSDGGTWQIAGVQLNVGRFPDGAPFQFLSYADQLQRCQRYYYKIQEDGNPRETGTGYFNTTTQANIIIPFPVEMRITPVMRLSSSAHFDMEPFDDAPTGISLSSTSNNQRAVLAVTSPTARTQGNAAAMLIDTAGGYIEFDAEF